VCDWSIHGMISDSDCWGRRLRYIGMPQWGRQKMKKNKGGERGKMV